MRWTSTHCELFEATNLLGYIALVRTSDRIPDPSVRDTNGDDLRSVGITMDGDDDFFMTHLTDDFSD